jgi:hypothetical protein
MSVRKKKKGIYEVRWREGGRHKSAKIHGSDELAKKVERKKLSIRDENRHLDVKKEINYKMSDLIDRYWEHYGSKKASADRERAIVEGIRAELGRMFVREVDGIDVQRWYENTNSLVAAKLFRMWWPETGSNRRRRPFQGRPASVASDVCGVESAHIIEIIMVVASSI